MPCAQKCPLKFILGDTNASQNCYASYVGDSGDMESHLDILLIFFVLSFMVV